MVIWDCWDSIGKITRHRFPNTKNAAKTKTMISIQFGSVVSLLSAAAIVNKET